MAIVRAQAILKHTSGFARDNVVNTFHFSGDPDGGRADELATAVRDMYINQPAGGIGSIAEYMAHGYTTVDVHLYEIPGTIDPGTGRESVSGPPFYSRLGATNDLANIAKLNAKDLPAEVAICLSYQGTPTTGLVQARRRGRVYFGPFNVNAVDMVSGVARPGVSIRQVLRDSFQAMLTATDPDFEFVVYSRPYAGRAAIPRVDKPDLPPIAARVGTTIGVDQLWIDDEFDTQRRRGLQRTGRTLVTAAG